MSNRQSSTVDRTFSIKHPASSGEATLRVVFVGHVDHGKSTLIGRILSDTNSLPEGKLEQVQRACAAENMEFEFAFLLDALLEEQEQNITIDTTQIPFKTAKRNYMIIDAPGHKEFLKNMITGASSADAAVLVIAANEGVQEQSKRHAYLLSLLGVRQFCVVVNKMDLADYSEARFLEIEKKYRVFLKTLNLETDVFIPASARFGENITARSTKMKWHHGPTLAEALDAMTPMAPPTDLPLRFCVQDVYKFDDRRIIAGRNVASREQRNSDRRRLDWNHIARTNFCRARVRRLALKRCAHRNEPFSCRPFLDRASAGAFIASLYCASRDPGSEMPDRLPR